MRGRGNRMIARRHFIAALSASTLAMPLHVLARQIPAKTRRIGILLFNSPRSTQSARCYKVYKSSVTPTARLLSSITDLPTANSSGFRASPRSWYRLDQT